MERIGEDEQLDINPIAAHAATGGEGPSGTTKGEAQSGQETTSRLHAFHAHARNHQATASGSSSTTPTANGNGHASGSSTYSTNPTSPSNNTNPSPKPSNASSYEARTRQQRDSQQAANRLMMQQIHQRLGCGNTPGVRRRTTAIRRRKTCLSYPAAAARSHEQAPPSPGTARPVSMVEADASAPDGAEVSYEGKGKAPAAMQDWEPPAKRVSLTPSPPSRVQKQDSEASLSLRSRATSGEETVRAVKFDAGPAAHTARTIEDGTAGPGAKYVEQRASAESLSPRSSRTSAADEPDSSRTSQETEADGDVDTVKAVEVDAASVGNCEMMASSNAASVGGGQQTDAVDGEQEQELSVDDWIKRMTDDAFYREGAW